MAVVVPQEIDAFTAPTADSVVRAVSLIRAGGVTAGAHTPSSAFGAGYAETLDGVELRLAA